MVGFVNSQRLFHSSGAVPGLSLPSSPRPCRASSFPSSSSSCPQGPKHTSQDPAQLPPSFLSIKDSAF